MKNANKRPNKMRNRLLRALGVGVCLTLAWAVVVGPPIAPASADTPIQQVLPFSRPRLTELRASDHKAFAHWHVWPISVENADPEIDWYERNELSPTGNDGRFYSVGGRMRQRPLPRPIRTEPSGVWQVRDFEDEVQRAAEIGLDGFAASICTLSDGPCWPDLTGLLEAAKNVDSGFKIMIQLDIASLSNTYTVSQIADAIASVAQEPALFRTADGRLVVSSTLGEGQSPQWWQSFRQQLANRGISLYLTLILQNYMQNSSAYAAVAEGLGSWGPGSPRNAKGTTDRSAEMHAAGKIYIAPVRSQMHRPKDSFYIEANNSEAFRATIMDAINGNADWFLIYTWNDGTEGGDMRPSTGVQWSFYDLAAYYTTWFKKRQAPLITRDVLYYFHRIHWTTSEPDPSKQPVAFALQETNQPAADQIELLAFLRSAGTLKITTNGVTYSQSAPAGLTSFRAPLDYGYPSFALVRDGATRISLKSAFNVRDRIDWQDLLYRGGSSTRPVVDMVANPPLLP